MGRFATTKEQKEWQEKQKAKKENIKKEKEREQELIEAEKERWSEYSELADDLEDAQNSLKYYQDRLDKLKKLKGRVKELFDKNDLMVNYMKKSDTYMKEGYISSDYSKGYFKADLYDKIITKIEDSQKKIGILSNSVNKEIEDCNSKITSLKRKINSISANLTELSWNM